MEKSDEMIPTDKALADMMYGTTKALQVICEQLIDRGFLDREILLSDLRHAQVEGAEKGVSLVGSIPAGLYAVLGGKPTK